MKHQQRQRRELGDVTPLAHRPRGPQPPVPRALQHRHARTLNDQPQPPRLAIASAIAALFRSNHLVRVLAVIATVPIFAWELSLGLWLAIKGFKPSPITAGMAQSEAAA